MAYVLHPATIAVLALVLDFDAPVLSRMAMGVFVCFWALVPILVSGVWGMAFWQDRSLSLFRDLKLNKNIWRVRI